MSRLPQSCLLCLSYIFRFKKGNLSFPVIFYQQLAVVKKLQRQKGDLKGWLLGFSQISSHFNAGFECDAFFTERIALRYYQ